MSRSDKKKLASAIIGLVILLLSVWQSSGKFTNSTVANSEIESVDNASTNVFEDVVPVVRVVDGDTIVVLDQNKEEKVRLIGINSPESVDPRKPVECFGQEASKYLKQLLSGLSVHLELDKTQAATDEYGRWLRVVYLAGGTDVNLQMIKDGYAHEYTYDVPYLKQVDYQAAEKFAEENKIGLWSPETCNGNP